jgi:hypothetical protein
MNNTSARLSNNAPLVALPLEGTDMIRITLHYFYDLGTVLHPLSKLDDGMKLTEIYGDLVAAESALVSLLNNTIIPLRTCYDSGSKLLAAIRVPMARMGQPNNELEFFEAFDITDNLEKFETVLSAELQILDAYYVSQKGAYSTVHLIETAHSMIPASILKDMPSGAIEDFKAGGRCLAFELPTAAGFHLLRATEAVLHEYYDAIATAKTIKPNATMGMYITNLETNGGDKKVMGVLRQITDLHRNPLIHPEDTLTTSQAIVLTGIVTSAIVAMVEGIQQKKAAPIPLATVIPPGATGTP